LPFYAQISTDAEASTCINTSIIATMSFGSLYYPIQWESSSLLECCPPFGLRKLFTSLFLVTHAHSCSTHSLGYANITASRPQSGTDQSWCDLAKK